MNFVNSVMTDASKITGIDWENPGVIRLFELCSGKLVPLGKEIVRLDMENAESNAAYANMSV